jgi:hypothetical protein
VALHARGLAITKVEQTATGGKPGGRSNLTPSCLELGLKALLFETVIRGRGSYELNGRVRNFQELLGAYADDLHKANPTNQPDPNCKYSIIVRSQPGLTAEDFVFTLKKLRSRFYAQLP